MIGRMEILSSRRRPAAVLYAALLAYVSLRAGDPLARTSWLSELLHNLAHPPAYAIFAYLLINAASAITPRILYGVFAITVLYGILLEVLQALIPDRFPSIGDILLNALGAGLIIWAFKTGRIERMGSRQ